MMASENEKKLNDNLLLFLQEYSVLRVILRRKNLKNLKKNASSMRLINEAVERSSIYVGFEKFEDGKFWQINARVLL